MKTTMVFWLLLITCVLTAFGCGSGGGGTPGPTVVTGVASKGIIRNGIVRLFEVNQDGTKGKILQETSTDADGRYQANLGNHSGPVLVEVTGSYSDETTGAMMAISDAAPLRAAVGKAVGAVTISVSPLTELALRQVEDPVSKRLAVGTIDAANARVGNIFGVSVVTTMPVDATKAVSAQATRAQKEYSLALAAISGMMSASGQDLNGLLSDLNHSVTGNALSVASASAFQAALQSFVSSDRNWTDIKDVTSTGLINVGGSTVKLRLTLVGQSSAAAKGVSVKLTLPAGVTLKARDGEVQSAVVSGSIPGGLFSAHYQPSAGTTPGTVRLAVISATKVAVGEVATISCDVPPGKTVGAGDFAIDYDVINNAGTVAGLAVVASIVD